MSDVLVLCYHALSPDWPATLSTTPERFAEQIEHLKAKGYVGVTFTEAVRRPIRKKTVAVTFDDAFRSVATHALPVLERAGWPATMFVPTNFPGAGPLAWDGIDEWLDGPHAHELAPLEWDELRDLQARGWEIGAHTCSHPHLTQVDDETLARELVTSREICERELGSCMSIAYPYGDVDQRVVAATAVAGYATAAALPAQWHKPSRLEWPRVGVYVIDDLRRFRLKTARLTRWLKTASTSVRAR